jgi:hypothetical protein
VLGALDIAKRSVPWLVALSVTCVKVRLATPAKRPSVARTAFCCTTLNGLKLPGSLSEL